MRFTKKLCALVSSLAVTASAQVVTQTPAPPTAPANPGSDDAQLREALRKALEGGPPSQPVPAQPVTPLPGTPVVPAIPTAPGPNLVPPPMSSYTVTNVITTNVTAVQLSLRDAIWMALEHNINIQAERYTPEITEYDRRALFGYYDPILNGSISKNHSERESGGFNNNTGNPFPPTKTDTDNAVAGLGGYLPTGMRYDISENINNTDATTGFLVGTNSVGQPIFGHRNIDTWNTLGTATLRQPLLRNFWIDSPRLQIKLRKRDVRISELDLERLVMNIINQVEKAYYNLIANRELVRVAEADIGVKKQFYGEQRRRVEVGTLAPLDEKLAQAEVAKSEINLITARKNAVDAEAVLKGLIHDNFLNQINTRVELSDRLLAVAEDLNLYESFREAAEKRPDLQAERLRVEKLNIQLKYDLNQLFPSLDLFGTYGLNGLDLHFPGALDDQGGGHFPQYSYGIALSFPFTFWTERNNYKATKSSKAKEILLFKQLEESIIQEVDFQVRLLRTTWITIPLRREQTAYEQAALEAEQQKMAVGKSTSFNVLKIASDLTQAQSDEIGTLRDYNQAVSELNFRKGTTLERWRIDRPARRNQ